MLHKLTIAKKFILLAVILSILMVVMNLSTVIRLNEMGLHISTIETSYLPITNSMSTISSDQLKQEIYFERAVRFASQKNTDKNIQAINHSIKEFNLYSQRVSDALKTSEQLIIQQSKVIENDNTLKELAEMHKELILIESQHATWSENATAILTSKNMNYSNEQQELFEKESKQLEESILKVLEKIELYTGDALFEIEEKDHQLIQEGIIFTIIGVIIGAAFSFYNIKALNIHMGKLIYSINELSKGKLNNSFKSKNISKDLGSVLDNIDGLREKLKTTLQLIYSSSSESQNAATNLNGLTSEVLVNIEKQSTEVDMLSTAMEEMGATSKDIASNAETTQTSTVDVTEFSLTCQNDMGEAISAMTQLITSLNNSASSILELEAQGQKISSVLDVIKSIADQTNLLALNAAIEAARAGEQGRGFAVVADEVRTLAQRTQDSTNEIEAMISAFKTETTNAVKSMEDSQGYAETMSSTAQKSKNNLTEISDTIGEVNAMTMQIASAAEEQAMVVQEINQNVQSVNDVIRKNTDSSAQVSAASEQIETISKQVLNEISYFKFS